MPLLLPYSLLGWPTSSTAGMMPPDEAEGELPRIPMPRTRVNKGMKKGRSVLAPALPLGIRLWLLPAAQQALGLLGPLSVLISGLAEELDQFLVAFLLRVFDVLVVHLAALG